MRSEEKSSLRFQKIVGSAFPSLLHVISRPRITLIGGGHGLSAVLSVLKPMGFDLTAIVAVSDDGGSSGILRDTFAMPPPGDLRRCLIALSDAPVELQDLFGFRFGARSGSGLDGHSFGNLALAALFEQTGGDLMQALDLSSRLLQVQGKVLPATTELVHLRALVADGRWIIGETAIASASSRIRRVSLEPGSVSPAPGVLEAITNADVVLIGPGSLYTSVIPPLLVSGVADALRSRAGRTVYLCNPLVQAGETDGYSAADHLRALMDHIGEGTIRRMLVNNQNREDISFLGEVVKVDGEAIAAYGLNLVTGDLLDLLE